MKYLAIPILLLLIILVSCKSLQNDGGKDWATVDFAVDGSEQEKTGFFASGSSATTVLIIAVPEDSATITTSQYLTEFYDRQLQDLSDNRVALRVPLNISMRLVKVVFREDLTLDSIVSNQPQAFSFGISAVFSVTGSEESKTVAITMDDAFYSKSITSFTFKAEKNTALSADVEGSIGDNNISLTVPAGADATALVATYTSTGVSVAVNSITQISGTSTNDFSTALIYTVTAADGTTQNYTVSIGFVISAISGNTTELGGTATFTARLTRKPSSDVSIGITSSDTTEGTVSPSSLTFTSSNWDTAQAVTVTGVYDQAADGDQEFTIELAAVSSSDPNYDSLDPADVTVTNAAVSSAAGSLDTTFNSTGYAVHHDAATGNSHDYGQAIAIDADGKILVSGYSLGASYDMALWRYNANGSLDTTFNSVGYSVHADAAGGSGYDVGYAIAVDADGKIVVAGHSNNGSNNDMVIWRYNADGSLDTTFNSPDGFTVHDNAAGGGSGADSGQAVVIDSDGKILVAGNSNNGSDLDMAIWRYNSDGSLDTTFNYTGYTVHDNAAGGSGADYGQAITIDSDGKILVAGYSWGSNNDMVIWRYNSDGSLDTTFDSKGYTIHDDAAGGGGDDYGYTIAIDSDGKILVVGNSNNGASDDMAIWRYNSDGGLDTTFNSVGYAAHDSAAGGSDYDYGKAVAIDSNGKALVAGYSYNGSEEDMAIWRFNTDGSLDTTFNSLGYVVHDSAAGGSGNDTGRGMAIDNDGRIIVAGYSINNTPDYDMAIWRYE